MHIPPTRISAVPVCVAYCMLTLHKSDFEWLVVAHLYVSRSLERETSQRMIDLETATAAD